MTGLGFFTIFQAALNYLVDTFHKYAASAVAANSESFPESFLKEPSISNTEAAFLRSCFAGAFPLIVGPLYHNVGIPWGTSIFAFFSLALIPVPFFFMAFGERIRARSAWSRL